MREIERSYLALWTPEAILRHAAEHGHAVTTKYIVPQAYVDDTGSWTCRVRVIRHPDGSLEHFYTMKRNVSDMSCDELETPVTKAFVDGFIALSAARIEKVRHTIAIGPHKWEVDVFLRCRIEGLVKIEVELDSEDEEVTPPEWVGAEVTGDARYANVNLAI